MNGFMKLLAWTRAYWSKGLEYQIYSEQYYPNLFSFFLATFLGDLLNTYLSHQGPSEAVVPTIMPFHWELFFFKRMMIGWWLTNQIRFLKHADWQPTTDQSRGSSRRGGLPPIGSCFLHFSLPGGQREWKWWSILKSRYIYAEELLVGQHRFLWTSEHHRTWQLLPPPWF